MEITISLDDNNMIYLISGPCVSFFPMATPECRIELYVQAMGLEDKEDIQRAVDAVKSTIKKCCGQ